MNSFNQPTITSNYSIYIPVIETGTDINYIIEHCSVIGAVERVDLVPRKKPNSELFYTNESFDAGYSAFVHFAFLHYSQVQVSQDISSLYFERIASLYYPHLTQDIVNLLERGHSYRFYLPPGKYWNLRKALNPVKSTPMNMHQVVDGCKILQARVDAHEYCINEYQATIEGLRKTVEMQKIQFERIYESLYHLLPSIFTPQSNSDEEIYSSSCRFYNMAHYGVTCETKPLLNEEEAKLYLEEKNKDAEGEQSDDDTHDSMPSLV